MGLPRSAFQTRKPPRAGRPSWKCAEEYKRWLRKLPCARCAQPAGNLANPTVAAHVDHAGGKGLSTKAPDSACIPLCDDCHKEQHRLGWMTFEKLLDGACAVILASIYWVEWLATDNGRAWERELAANPAPQRGRAA